MQSFRISKRCSFLRSVLESSRSWLSDSRTAASSFEIEVKKNVMSKETIISSGWKAVFLSFNKKCSADLTVVGGGAE